MLRLLKNTTFSTAVEGAPDTKKNIKTIFKTSDTRLLDEMCDVNTEKKNDVLQKSKCKLIEITELWECLPNLTMSEQEEATSERRWRK